MHGYNAKTVLFNKKLNFKLDHSLHTCLLGKNRNVFAAARLAHNIPGFPAADCPTATLPFGSAKAAPQLVRDCVIDFQLQATITESNINK